MSEHASVSPATLGVSGEPTSRRGLFRLGSWFLGLAIKAAVLIPAAGFLLTPLLRRAGAAQGFTPLVPLGELEVGVPRSFPIIQPRQDAWIRYPDEPVGTVWLVRQPAGSKQPVLALSAECPHLACSINLAADGKGFFCPCHTSSFQLDGERVNKVSPRGMDPLEVEPLDPDDPSAMVRVRYQRFRTMTEERIPLA